MLRRILLRFRRLTAVDLRPDRVIGPALVLDGDSIIVAGQNVRLHGIDAPELDQTFWCNGKRMPSGSMALAALEALTAGFDVRCEAVERDRFGRVIAKCFSPAGIDIGERMVSAGWALAYRHFSTDYVRAENAARRARRGLWRGSFMPPWEWRARTAQQVRLRQSGTQLPGRPDPTPAATAR